MTDDSADIEIEDSTEDGDTGTAEQKLKLLRDKLRRAEAEAGENLAGWQRAKADYVNLQKRSREDFALVQDSGVSGTLAELAPVFDSIQASAHEAVIKQLDAALVKLGAERYQPNVGDVFDPNIHEPVSTVATSDQSLDNTIHSVLQSGYRRGTGIIRPARVTVYHFS